MATIERRWVKPMEALYNTMLWTSLQDFFSDSQQTETVNDNKGFLRSVEGSEKPVIAAVHGTVLGGGFELALSAHYRIAHEKAQ